MHALECIPFVGNVLECLATIGAAFLAYGFGCTLFLLTFNLRIKKCIEKHKKRLFLQKKQPFRKPY